MTNDELSELLDEAYEHLRQGRYRMALTSAKRVYEQRPEDFNAVSCLAWATLENGNPYQALELANLAVQISREAIDSRLYRGFLLMRMGLFEGAISDLDWAIERKPSLLSWAYLNKARALAGLERYFEGLEEIDKAIEIDEDENPKLLGIREWFREILGYNEKFFGGLFNKKKNILEEAEEALHQKEYWFTLWAARDCLNTPAMQSEHKHAHILELEAMLGMFQLRAAEERARNLRPFIEDDERFQDVYQRILKSTASLRNEPKMEEELIFPGKLRTDFERYPNQLFNIFHAKVFNYLESTQSGKRTYMLNFMEGSIRYIGLEVCVDNPFFGNKNMNVDGTAVWYLNGSQIAKHDFILQIEKDWQILEFVQSWGSDSPDYWKRGQGRVEIFLNNVLVAARYFGIDESEVFNFEKSEVSEGKVDNLEVQITEQPSGVKEATENPQETKSIEELLEELNTFVGLNVVKQSMKDFVDYLKYIHERKKLGLKTSDDLSAHSLFLGNPGTGKTTIARLLGKIFKAMGLLQNGHVIEVDRAALVGQFIGETAQKTEKIINEALGGLLFIDEAYNLKKAGAQNDFGQEAIDILLKRMEDKAGEFVVIAAGYPEEMKNFINSNPGLKSRFTHFFDFEDYTPDEMVEIFKQFANKEEYAVDDEALNLLKKEFVNKYRRRDESFGNARLVRNYYSEAKLQLSKRVLRLPEEARIKEVMTTITSEDIVAILQTVSAKHVNFDIDEDALSKSLNKLNNLSGLASVKKEINEIVKLARFYIEQGENPREKFSSHFLFLGNPGTGKTTVARLFSEIFNALGILEKGHLIETDRQGLVGSFVGQTAIKTKEIIDKAVGGTLFIDEAYTLSKEGETNDFGHEAIDALLKRMEDDRGKYIVIVAGYTGEMQRFIESNPGLKSRFTRQLNFEDYKPDELLEIAKRSFSEKGYRLDEETWTPLKSYFDKIFRGRDKYFGNARMVRNLVESTLKNHLLRIADFPPSERHEEVLKVITLEDMKDFISLPTEKASIKIDGDPVLLDQYLHELNELIGIENVKLTLNKLVSSLKIAKLRKERGFKVLPKNLNAVFAGSRGTGKNTVAKIYGKILKEIGFLEKGHVIKTDTNSLVSAYQGQTAEKTETMIKKAIGGILYIEEACNLRLEPNDPGYEVFNTIVNRTETDGEKFITIISGYENEMKEYLNQYPALQNFIPNHFLFEDFTPRQMLEIALAISSKHGYKLDEGAWQLLLEIFNNLFDNRSYTFGNAVTVKNIFYKVIANQEERILSLHRVKDEDLTTIIFDDVNKVDMKEFT